MANPQQPELARSRKTPALSPDATEGVLTAQGEPKVDAGTGPIPADNLPGHHPEHEQDKPDGDAFVAKVRARAAEVAEDTGAQADTEADTEADVVDLRAADQERPDSERAERLASLVTTPLRGTAKALEELRKRL